jgi:hypothetical protein
LKEKEYIQIVKITDEILKSPLSCSTRVAIPWLHVIREHPVFLKNYESLFPSNEKIVSYLKIYKSLIFYKLSLIQIILKSIFFSNSKQWLKKIQQISKKDIIFISHLLNISQFSDDEDFYFSNLPKKLLEGGYSSLTVLLNHTGVELTDHSNREKDNLLSKLILPRTMSFLKEIQNLKLLWIESKNLRREGRLESDNLKNNVFRMAANEALSPSSLGVMRLATQLKEIAEITNPKILITTHEGHAWERLVYSAVRKVKPGVKCIGYTHAPIFRKQHAVRRSLSNEYNPDIIYSSGHNQKYQLDKSPLLKNIPVKVLGSVRFFKSRSDIFEVQRKESDTFKKDMSCLVIPEGIESEINKLFEYSLKCALLIPEVIFVWRLHPLFSFEKLISGNKLFQSLPTNIKLSEKNLNDDIKICQWVLYRGSSAVIQAVLAGLKPIYLHSSGEMKIDPIFEIKNWKSEVETVMNAQKIFNISAGNYEDYSQAKKYCLDMYTPLDSRLLIDTLSKIHSNE